MADPSAHPTAGVLAEPTNFRWHVLHTRSRQEKALAEYLAAAGVDHFLPLTRAVRYYGRRKAVVAEPLFSGYVFVRGTLEQCYEADRTDRVAGIIGVSDQGRLERELAQVRDALLRGAPLVSGRYLDAGAWAEVRAGPFRGLRGVIDRGSPNDRLLLQVRMLGRAAELEVDRSLLDPIDDL